MTTMAQIQASTLDESVKRLVIAEQFAEDFILVSDNDYDFYSAIKETANDCGTVSTLSDSLRADYEYLIEQVCELVDKQISPVAYLLISQLLNNQGSLPFDIIARHYLEKEGE